MKYGVVFDSFHFLDSALCVTPGNKISATASDGSICYRLEYVYGKSEDEDGFNLYMFEPDGEYRHLIDVYSIPEELEKQLMELDWTVNKKELERVEDVSKDLSEGIAHLKGEQNG